MEKDFGLRIELAWNRRDWLCFALPQKVTYNVNQIIQGLVQDGSQVD